jgi:hypothetical protein
MFANLTISINLKDRWTLPASAIFTHADQPHCWRCDKDGKALRTPLKLGVREGQTVEVLKMQVDGAWQAVSGSEQVVIANLGAVSEGKQIAP